MTVDLERRPDPIATGRSWRDIPPYPPAETPMRPQLPPASPDTRPGSRPWIPVALLLAILGAVGVGIWSPWSDAAPGDDAAARSTSSTNAPAQASTTLPEEIVPPPAEDPLPGAVLPEDFFSFEGFPDFFEFFNSGPRFDGRVQGDLNLIELSVIPEGYRISGTAFRGSAESVTEEITLSGGSGSVSVTAQRRANPVLPDGAAHEVGDISGVLLTDDGITFAWLAADDLKVTVEASAGVSLELVEAIASGVEVVR